VTDGFQVANRSFFKTFKSREIKLVEQKENKMQIRNYAPTAMIEMRFNNYVKLFSGI